MIEEKISHPSHYNMGAFEVIEVIEDWKLGFCLGNAVKYISRANHKDNGEDDLKKALWYLARELHVKYGANQAVLAKLMLDINKRDTGKFTIMLNDINGKPAFFIK